MFGIGFGFMALIVVIYAVYHDANASNIAWKDGEFQRRRREAIEGGLGDIVDSAEMHRKFGYTYDPWFPALRQKAVEGEKKLHKGFSRTEWSESQVAEAARVKGRIINWDKPQAWNDRKI